MAVPALMRPIHVLKWATWDGAYSKQWAERTAIHQELAVVKRFAATFAVYDRFPFRAEVEVVPRSITGRVTHFTVRDERFHLTTLIYFFGALKSREAKSKSRGIFENLPNRTHPVPGFWGNTALYEDSLTTVLIEGFCQAESQDSAFGLEERIIAYSAAWNLSATYGRSHISGRHV
ncbi:hypothetical protein R1flu_016781 [Riccia fluitans]|uniref:Uncharacterized protein n=1 Tax=Riccia fluitans TaxID=41844 RepID=A0ABD1YNN0_9MARC